MLSVVVVIVSWIDDNNVAVVYVDDDDDDDDDDSIQNPIYGLCACLSHSRAVRKPWQLCYQLYRVISCYLAALDRRQRRSHAHRDSCSSSDMRQDRREPFPDMIKL